MGREGAGDDFRIVFRLEFSVFYGKFLLKDHRVFVFRIAVAAKTKVAEAVYDVAPVVFFDALKYMGMMAEYQRGSAVDGVVPEGFTISGKKMNNFTPGTLSIFQSELSCFNVHSE